ncbi:hypothetical protein ACFOW4_12645 [Micromonospora sp. GCM10011542]|uniref:hypothetical protein n=1 Tax=Micromonospora sp. GCM10011542 TaxID=3317337 RepID=UPI00362083A7
MSSDPPSERARRPSLPGWLAGRSLRTRLVLALVALLALVSIAIGGLTTVALRHVLINQVDTQLTMGNRRAAEVPPWFRPGGDPPWPGAPQPGPGPPAPEPPRGC